MRIIRFNATISVKCGYSIYFCSFFWHLYSSLLGYLSSHNSTPRRKHGLGVLHNLTCIILHTAFASYHSRIFFPNTAKLCNKAKSVLSSFISTCSPDQRDLARGNVFDPLLFLSSFFMCFICCFAYLFYKKISANRACNPLPSFFCQWYGPYSSTTQRKQHKTQLACR